MNTAEFVAAGEGGEGAGLFTDFRDRLLEALRPAADRLGLRLKPRVVRHQLRDICLFFHKLY